MSPCRKRSPSTIHISKPAGAAGLERADTAEARNRVAIAVRLLEAEPLLAGAAGGRNSRDRVDDCLELVANACQCGAARRAGRGQRLAKPALQTPEATRAQPSERSLADADLGHI